MAGLTIAGFTPEKFEDIKARISNLLKSNFPSIDLSPETPDGQMLEIFSFELADLWSQLGAVYESFDPNIATGNALRNIGHITGVDPGYATNSSCWVRLDGTEGVLVPSLTQLSDSEGNIFVTAFEGRLPFIVEVMAQQPGPIPVVAGSVNTVVSQIDGLDSVDHANDGITGYPPKSDAHYRSLRAATVSRNHTGTAGAIQARLLELGLQQASVQDNDTNAPLSDGTPAQHIHVTVGEVGPVTDEAIASVILDFKGLGTPTFGSTTIAVEDSQRYLHDVSFTKASEVFVFLDLNVTFLDDDNAGAVEAIREDLVEAINSIPAGDDVIWSRLFPVITPHSKAQINSLNIGKSLDTLAPENIVLNIDEYSSTDAGSINITVV